MLRSLWLLALFALIALSSAFNLDGVEEYIHHGVKRQASGTGNNNAPTSAAAPASSVVPPPASSPQPKPDPTPTPAASTTPDSTPEPETSAAPPPAQSSQAPAASTTPNGGGQTTQSPQRTSAGAPAATSKAAATSAPRSSAIVRTTPLVSTSLEAFTVVTRTTLPNGQETEVTSTGTRSAIITTGQATYTEPATSQENTDSGSGLSESNKKVIGGVVGGIGGALLLGGIALVFWRMKKRQSKVTADDDDLNLNTGAALGDKPPNGTGSSPFQSNLEQYHNPGGRPNAAANF